MRVTPRSQGTHLSLFQKTQRHFCIDYLIPCDILSNHENDPSGIWFRIELIILQDGRLGLLRLLCLKVFLAIWCSHSILLTAQSVYIWSTWPLPYPCPSPFSIQIRLVSVDLILCVIPWPLAGTDTLNLVLISWHFSRVKTRKSCRITTWLVVGVLFLRLGSGSRVEVVASWEE